MSGYTRLDTAEEAHSELVQKQTGQAHSPRPTHPEPMQIFVQLMGGQKKTVELEGADTIAAAKLKIAQATGIHPTHQRLLLGAEELSDERTVEDYGLRMEAELKLAERPAPRTVKLDVGGTPYTTTLSTLVSQEGSVLASLVTGTS